MEAEWVKVVVIVIVSCCCDCCCGRSVNQWLDFVEGLLAGCGCGWRRRCGEFVPERRGKEIIKNVKKKEYFIK